MTSTFLRPVLGATAFALLLSTPTHAEDRVRTVVDAAVEPMMEEHGIPGLLVAVLVDDKRYVFHYGVASRKSERLVDERTVFEFGSLSKLFTGTLGARLAAEGTVDLSASAESLLPALEGSPIGGASLLQLATSLTY